MQPPAGPRRKIRISGKLTLLIMALLALLFAGPLYWALFQLSSTGKEGLRTHPPASPPQQKQSQP